LSCEQLETKQSSDYHTCTHEEGVMQLVLPVSPVKYFDVTTSTGLSVPCR